MLVVKIGTPIAMTSGQTSGGAAGRPASWGRGRRREAGRVDAPADAADASRADVQLEESTIVRIRKRHDDVEARETGQQHDVVQRSVPMVRRCGDRQGDATEQRAQPDHAGAEVVREMNDVGTKRSLAPSDLPDDDRQGGRLARVVVDAAVGAMPGIEARVRPEVYGDLRDMADREAVRRGRLQVDGERLDFVARGEQSLDDVEPEVLVPGVAERQDPHADDDDPQTVLPEFTRRRGPI